MSALLERDESRITLCCKYSRYKEEMLVCPSGGVFPCVSGLGCLRLCGKGIHHARRVDQRRTGVDGNGDAERFGDLIAGRAVLQGRIGVYHDASVALPRDRDGKRD